MYSNLKSSISTLEQAHSQIQQLQVASPVHMYHANSKSMTSMTWTANIGSSVTSSTDDTNSGQEQTATAMAACSINGAQQQHHHQRRVTLDNFQLSYGQTIQGQVSQIIDASRASPACWPSESPACWPAEAPIGFQDLTVLRPANIFQLEGLPVSGFQGYQVQDDQPPQNISNAQILQSRGICPNLIAAGAVSSTPNFQQMQDLIPIQTVNAGTEISSQELQRYPNDSNKGQVAATATNPETESTPNQHFEVTQFGNPNPAIAIPSTTATSTKSQSSNSELNILRRNRRYACTCPNCIYPGKRNNEVKRKHICNFPGCTKGFRYTSQLLVHNRTHTGEKPSVCSWMSCGIRFRRADTLSRHQRTHTGEKRFQCTDCFKIFSRTDHLSKHLKTHHRKRT